MMMYKILIYIIFLSVPLVLSDTPKELYSFNSVEDQERFSNLLVLKV